MGRLIFSPFRRAWAASRDNLCRRSRTARKSCGMDRGRSLSSQRSRDSRLPLGRREIRKAAGGEASSAAFRPLGLLRDVRENFKFLFFRGGGKAGNAGKEFGGGLLRGPKAFLIDRQRVAEKSFQGAVDEVDHAGLARAGSRIRRDDARAEGFNLARLVRGENFQRGMT